MKHISLIIGMLCFVVFSVNGCGKDEQPAESKKAVKTEIEEPTQAVEEGMDKSKELIGGTKQDVKETGETNKQEAAGAAEEGVEKTKELVEETKQDVDETGETNKQEATGAIDKPKEKTDKVIEASKNEAEEAYNELYTVKKGDTLFSIARKHGVSVQQIVEVNNLTDKDLIYPGSKLKIPQSK